MNLDLGAAGVQRKFQRQELQEIRLEAYENSKNYKQKVKRFPGIKLIRKNFEIGQKVLLYNSRMKLRSRQEWPFEIDNIFSHGVVEIQKMDNEETFKVNGNQLKIFQEL